MQSVNRHHANTFAVFQPVAALLSLRHGRLRTWLQSIGFACVLAAAVFSANIFAQTAQLRLGNPQVLSALGSPLWIKIPINLTEPADELTASRFSLGGRPLNAPVPFVDRAELSLERASGKYFLVIRTRNAIDEPAVGIVIREELPSGARSREFYLLLDPAPLTVAVSDEQNRDSPRANAADPITATASPRSTGIQPPTAITATPDIAAAPSRKNRRDRQARTREATASNTRTSAAASRSQSSISPIESRAARKNRGVTLQPGRPPQPTRTAPSTDGGPRLKLSFGEGLTVRPATTEAERAELRMRQFTLDMDDLTSGLLERQHKITQLEKELVSLSLRVSAAERLIGALPPAIAGAAIVPTVPAVAGTADPAATPAASTAAMPANLPAETATPIPAAVTAPADRIPAPTTPPADKNSGNATVAARATSLWTRLLVGAALLAALVTAIWGIRRMLRRRDQTFRITTQRAEDYVAEVLSHQSPTKTAAATKTVATPLGKSAVKVAASTPDFPPAEIHFELPELTQETTDFLDLPTTTNEIAPKAVTNVMRKPSDDAASRRMRYLQSRYQDIAILMPPLDAPQRLLRQAATVYDEGATDFAKRLLKFSAYSRPYTEEFWLALLELLYREKFTSDYVVNAKWFRQYHPDSTQWDEVVRIGYLLDAHEPLFGVASHWSHDEPAAGVWLPSTTNDKKPVTPPPHLKLELDK